MNLIEIKSNIVIIDKRIFYFFIFVILFITAILIISMIKINELIDIIKELNNTIDNMKILLYKKKFI